MAKQIQIYEEFGTDLLYIITDSNSDASYYDKNTLTVAAVNGNVVIAENNIAFFSELPRDFINPLESSVVDLVEIIQGYLNNLQPVLGSPLNPLAIRYGDSPILDAFSRVRTSGTGQRFDVEFLYDKQEEIIDEVIGGAGTVVHNSNERDLTLSTNGVLLVDAAEMLSYPIPYTPGNSQFMAITGSLDGGLLGDGIAQIFLRSNVTGSVTEEVIDQENWNNPVSDVNWQYSQIFEIDFQSLKVGRIRYYLNRNGITTQVHEIVNDNKRVSGYWQLPELPVSWRIYNDATYTYTECCYGDESNAVGFRYRVPLNALQKLRAICATVKSEGGVNLPDIHGYNRSASRGISSKTVSKTVVPLISIRPKTTFLGQENHILSIPNDLSILTNNPIYYAIYHDSSLTSAVWNDVETTESSMEYDISATSFTNGYIVGEGYVSSEKNKSGSVIGGLTGKTVLWNRKGTETGIFTICAVRTTSKSASVLTSLNWKELR